MPSDKLNEPGTMIEIVVWPPGGEPAPFRILIDGTHRAARRLRDGLECWAYLLTEDEQRSICTYRGQGGRLAIPTLPGHGITDRDAGIEVRSTGEADVA